MAPESRIPCVPTWASEIIKGVRIATGSIMIIIPAKAVISTKSTDHCFKTAKVPAFFKVAVVSAVAFTLRSGSWMNMRLNTVTRLNAAVVIAKV